MNSTLFTLFTRRPHILRFALVIIVMASVSQAAAPNFAPRASGQAVRGSTRNVGRSRLVVAYLPSIGVAPFRFAPFPPEPVDRPAPIDLKHSETPPAARPEITPVTATSVIPMDEVKADLSPPAEPGPKPITILPDDTPHELRVEDALPYFQLPTPAQDRGINQPFAPTRPDTLPPSSATYQQR